MFVVRFANLSLARYLTNPRVIAWLPALKGPLEPRLIIVLSLLKRRDFDSKRMALSNQRKTVVWKFPRTYGTAFSRISRKEDNLARSMYTQIFGNLL